MNRTKTWAHFESWVMLWLGYLQTQIDRCPTCIFSVLYNKHLQHNGSEWRWLGSANALGSYSVVLYDGVLILQCPNTDIGTVSDITENLWRGIGPFNSHLKKQVPIVCNVIVPCQATLRYQNLSKSSRHCLYKSYRFCEVSSTKLRIQGRPTIG